MFAAVDRRQSEVEFRLALLPAFAALAVAIAVRSGPLTAAGAIAIGGLITVALLLDAARQEREANKLILSLMEHGRLSPPSLRRALADAEREADQAPASVVRRQAAAVSKSLNNFISSLDRIPSSGSVTQLTTAHEASREVRREADELDRLLGTYRFAPPEPLSVELALEPLDRALSGWHAISGNILPTLIPSMDWPGDGPTALELQDLLRKGREAHTLFVSAARQAVGAIAARDAQQATLTMRATPTVEI